MQGKSILAAHSWNTKALLAHTFVFALLHALWFLGCVATFSSVTDTAWDYCLQKLLYFTICQADFFFPSLSHKVGSLLLTACSSESPWTGSSQKNKHGMGRGRIWFNPAASIPTESTKSAIRGVLLSIHGKVNIKRLGKPTSLFYLSGINPLQSRQFITVIKTQMPNFRQQAPLSPAAFLYLLT